jgi:hypothetical protein
MVPLTSDGQEYGDEVGGTEGADHDAGKEADHG